MLIYYRNMKLNEFYGVKIPTDFELSSLETLQSYFRDNYDALVTSFSQFASGSVGVIREAEEYLKTGYSDDPSVIASQLDSLVSISYSLGERRNNAETFLLIFEIVFFLNKEKGLMEDDRKRFTKAKTITQKK